MLYASGQLQGAAQTWWESYQAARPNDALTVTWQEFCRDFKARHINEGMIEIRDNCGTTPVLELNSSFAPIFLTLLVCPCFFKTKPAVAPIQLSPLNGVKFG